MRKNEPPESRRLSRIVKKACRDAEHATAVERQHEQCGYSPGDASNECQEGDLNVVDQNLSRELRRWSRGVVGLEFFLNKRFSKCFGCCSFDCGG